MKSCNRSVYPQMTAVRGRSALNDFDIKTIYLVKQLDLRPQVIGYFLSTKPANDLFDPLFFNIIEGHNKNFRHPKI